MFLRRWKDLSIDIQLCDSNSLDAIKTGCKKANPSTPECPLCWADGSVDRSACFASVRTWVKTPTQRSQTWLHLHFNNYILNLFFGNCMYVYNVFFYHIPSQSPSSSSSQNTQPSSLLTPYPHFAISSNNSSSPINAYIYTWVWSHLHWHEQSSSGHTLILG